MTNDVVPQHLAPVMPDDPMQYSFVDSAGNEVTPNAGIVRTRQQAEMTLNKAQAKLQALQTVKQLLLQTQRRTLNAPHAAKVKAKRRKKNKMANESRRRNR